jgi:putative redox protein
MPGVSVKWTGGQQFLAADEAGHVVVTDSEGQGFKPPDLLLVSLVGCAGVDVVRILEKKRQKITSIEVNITKENEPDPPWCIRRIDIRWVIRGLGVKQKAVEDAVRLAEEGYCSVSASLNAEVVNDILVINEEK